MRARLATPVIVFAGALLVYLLTMPPGLTWAHDSADGGDLIAAAVSGGVPHPSGYPVYLMLATPLARLPWHTPAWRVTLLSALSGAAAAALAAAAVQTLLRPAGRAAWPALLAGLSLAFSTALWAQSTVAEVYALHACLAAALLWAAVHCQESSMLRWPLAAGLLFGLAMGNHLSSLWLAPLWLVAVLSGSGRRAPVVLAGLGGLLLGLSVYLALPLRAMAGPPVNWGDASSLDGLWWLVSGQLYRGYVFAVPWTAIPGRVAAAAGLLWQSFLPWGVALAVAGMVRWPRRQRPVNLAMLASAALGLIWALGYNTSDSHLAWLSAWPLIAVWLGVGLYALMGWLRDAAGQRRWLPVVAAAALAGLLIVTPLAANWSANDLRRDAGAEAFVAGVLDTLEPDALVVASGDRATFALWYGVFAAGRRADVLPVNRDLWPLASYRRTVLARRPSLAGAAGSHQLDSLVDAARAAGYPVYVVQAGPADLPAPAAPIGLAWQVQPAPVDAAGQPLWRIWRLGALD